MLRQRFGRIFANFAAFITFCDLNNQPVLPANAMITAEFIRHISVSGRSSASIRRVVVAISAVHLLNRLTDPTKDPEVRIAMKRIIALSEDRPIKPMVLGRIWSTCFW